MIRRLTFKGSKSSYTHWLPLMLADRVNAAEALAEDLARGQVPNLITGWGWKVECSITEQRSWREF